MSLVVEPTKSIKIFYCYAHADEIFRSELEKQLRILKRQGHIINWCDREISAGKEREREINKHLDTAQLILLLISSDFMDSEYCYSVQMKRALERHENGEARVIPIILRHAFWEDAPFNKLQALPTNGKPVKSWLDPDEAFLDIARGIRKVILELSLSNKVHEGNNQYEAQFYTEALATYEQVILLDPNMTSAYVGKGNVLIELKCPAEALAAFEHAIFLEPKLASAYIGKGLALSGLNRYTDALKVYKQAILCDSQSARAYYLKGNVLFELKQYEEAVEAFEKAIKLNPDSTKAYLDQGNTLVELKRYTEALVAYEQAIRLSPTLAEAYISKSKVFCELQRYAEASTTYEQAIQLDPAFIDIHYQNRLLQYLVRQNTVNSPKIE